MNIHDAARSGKPFFYSDMIGGFLIVDGALVHRDNINDFKNMEFIRRDCLPDSSDLYWLDTDDLIRLDWKIETDGRDWI